MKDVKKEISDDLKKINANAKKEVNKTILIWGGLGIVSALILWSIL